MGDLGALQSEPRSAQIERVILLLKLSAAAFVQVRDVTEDGGGLEKLGPPGSLRAQGTAGKTLGARRAEKASV